MTVLLVDGDAAAQETMRARFEDVGFDVSAATGPDGALAALESDPPDAIVLDELPPQTTQPAVVRRIRRHPRGARVPIIVLTAHPHGGDAVDALDAGADDVLVKPFAPDDMLARVRGKIARARADAALQPMTKLPGTGPMEAAIRRRLAERAPWSLLFVDLDGLERFNDEFGYTTGDVVLRLLGDVVVDAVHRRGAADDVVGHVGADDFLVVTTPGHAADVADTIVTAFDRGVRSLTRDARVPYCTVSVAVVSGEGGAVGYERVLERAAAVKKAGKRRRGSVVMLESELHR